MAGDQIEHAVEPGGLRRDRGGRQLELWRCRRARRGGRDRHSGSRRATASASLRGTNGTLCLTVHFGYQNFYTCADYLRVVIRDASPLMRHHSPRLPLAPPSLVVVPPRTTRPRCSNRRSRSRAVASFASHRCWRMIPSFQRQMNSSFLSVRRRAPCPRRTPRTPPRTRRRRARWPPMRGAPTSRPGRPAPRGS